MARSNAYVGGGRKLNGVCKMICGFKDDGTMGMVVIIVKWVMKFLTQFSPVKSNLYCPKKELKSVSLHIWCYV